jgi:hypothetical protein
VRARPVERDSEQLPAEAATARVGAEVHPLQLDGAVAEVAKRRRSDDVAPILRDPQRGVRRPRIVEVAVERRVRLEAELAQRVLDERAEAIGVTPLERDD